jgi:hypothetical protein
MSYSAKHGSRLQCAIFLFAERENPEVMKSRCIRATFPVRGLDEKSSAIQNVHSCTLLSNNYDLVRMRKRTEEILCFKPMTSIQAILRVERNLTSNFGIAIQREHENTFHE